MKIKNLKLKASYSAAAVFCGVFYFSFVSATSTLGETRTFSVDPSYDYTSRKEVSATMIQMSDNLYFYIDDAWWNGISQVEKSKASAELTNLGAEFKNKIYPTLTSFYGPEWNPGIDNDSRITILFHKMKKNNGGYFNSGNEYSKVVLPASNEREMLYVNADYITTAYLRRLIAHELVHLITFNQKDRLQDIEEEVWLNEGRAEYASTLLGYDNEYTGSNLEKRVKEFLRDPSDSVVEWNGSSSDYGVLNIFIQYLVEQYGADILIDSLHSNKTGIDSINYVLDLTKSPDDFGAAFTNWTIAVLINDCSISHKYCFKNPDLKMIRVMPQSNFLPTSSSSQLTANYITKGWAGNWHKIFGGGGILTFDFSGTASGNFRVPYVICDSNDSCSVKILDLSKDSAGQLIVDSFNNKYTSLTVIPAAQADSGRNFQFTWKAGADLGDSQAANSDIAKLLAQIEYLKSEIAKVQSALAAKGGKGSNGLGGQNVPCSAISGTLSVGLMNNPEVSCLQGFLKNQGTDIYPEGLITGNFYGLTKSAVIRFQEKYKEEILTPVGLSSGTGVVGEQTRKKINALLSAK